LRTGLFGRNWLRRRTEWRPSNGGHAGYLLNECADMLSTKGVRNETPPARVQFVHPINEDTDMTEYTFKDGELPVPPSNWTGDTVLPENILYPLARLNLASTEPVTDSVATVAALSESSPYSVMLSDSEEILSGEESSNPWPALRPTLKVKTGKARRSCSRPSYPSRPPR
jgi:hypothetical protein